MNDIVLNIIDIKTILPHYTLVKNGNTYEIIEVTERHKDGNIIEQINLVGSDFDTNDNILHKNCKTGGYKPDLELGAIGEKYVLSLLENEKLKNKNIYKVEWVAETRKTYDGYDIEVILKNKTKLGVEVKSTREEFGNVFYITFNELKTLIEMSDRYYLVIVNYNHDKDSVKSLYVLKNPAKSLELSLKEISELIQDRKLNKIKFHALQYRVEIPIGMLKEYKQFNEFIIMI